jgi:hypothetical protein
VALSHSRASETNPPTEIPASGFDSELQSCCIEELQVLFGLAPGFAPSTRAGELLTPDFIKQTTIVGFGLGPLSTMAHSLLKFRSQKAIGQKVEKKFG